MDSDAKFHTLVIYTYVQVSHCTVPKFYIFMISKRFEMQSNTAEVTFRYRLVKNNLDRSLTSTLCSAILGVFHRCVNGTISRSFPISSSSSID